MFTVAAKILSDGQFFVPIKKNELNKKVYRTWDRLNGLSFVKEFNIYIKQPMRENFALRNVYL